MIRLLFENFNVPDLPADAAEPVSAEPLFDAAALSAAKQEAWNEGYLTASKGHARTLADECRQVHAELLACSEEMDRKLVALAEGNAASLARWLVGTFVTAFPILAADRPDGRIQAVADLLQPVLRSQCRIELRAGDEPTVVCCSMHDVWQRILQRQAEPPAAGSSTAGSSAAGSSAAGSSAAGSPATSDIIIAWPQGEARISSTSTWDDIRAAIMPLAEHFPVGDPAGEASPGGDATGEDAIGDRPLQFTLKQRELLGHV